MTSRKSISRIQCLLRRLDISSGDGLSSVLERILRDEMLVDRLRESPDDLVQHFGHVETLKELMKCVIASGFKL